MDELAALAAELVALASADVALATTFEADFEREEATEEAEDFSDAARLEADDFTDEARLEAVPPTIAVPFPPAPVTEVKRVVLPTVVVMVLPPDVAVETSGLVVIAEEPPVEAK